jgi:hypothetical protein
MAATPDRVNAELRRRLAFDTPPPPQVARGNLSHPFLIRRNPSLGLLLVWSQFGSRLALRSVS